MAIKVSIGFCTCSGSESFAARSILQGRLNPMAMHGNITRTSPRQCLCISQPLVHIATLKSEVSVNDYEVTPHECPIRVYIPIRHSTWSGDELARHLPLSQANRWHWPTTNCIGDFCLQRRSQRCDRMPITKTILPQWTRGASTGTLPIRLTFPW